MGDGVCGRGMASIERHALDGVINHKQGRKEVKMKEISVGGVVSSLLAAVVVCAFVAGCRCPCMKHGRGAGGMQKAAAVSSVYACPECHTMALKAGPCAMCKKDMQEKHLLGMKDGQAMLCSCGAGCKCDAKGMKDGKCGCGKEVTMVNCKGTYCCAMGCPDMSDKPGTCACGMEFKKCE
jgi:hypothetical protein